MQTRVGASARSAAWARSARTRRSSSMAKNIIVDRASIPEAELHGVDLVVPDYALSSASASTAARHPLHPRPRGPHRRAAVPDHAARAARSDPDLRHAAHPRPDLGQAATSTACSGACMQHAIRAGERAQLGPFEVEPIAVNHSIPDAVGLVIRTPAAPCSTPATSSSTRRRSRQDDR